MLASCVFVNRAEDWGLASLLNLAWLRVEGFGVRSPLPCYKLFLKGLQQIVNVQIGG